MLRKLPQLQSGTRATDGPIQLSAKLEALYQMQNDFLLSFSLCFLRLFIVVVVSVYARACRKPRIKRTTENVYRSTSSGRSSAICPPANAPDRAPSITNGAMSVRTLPARMCVIAPTALGSTSPKSDVPCASCCGIPAASPSVGTITVPPPTPRSPERKPATPPIPTMLHHSVESHVNSSSTNDDKSHGKSLAISSPTMSSALMLWLLAAVSSSLPPSTPSPGAAATGASEAVASAAAPVPAT
mmetsp:Transcript_1850/g.4895  ORF Transcript_1850/g.4895 Transcript_1850/m.4895 type:complete len:243 (+) Transcript_1850:644-1372(+)